MWAICTNNVHLDLRIGAQKGEINHNYVKAEKGNSESQKLLANAYRIGKVFSVNHRLADFWENMSDSQ